MQSASSSLPPPSSSPSAFTPLESLLLFQSVLKNGVEPDAFVRTAAVLQSNPFVRSDERFDVARLNAESLQRLFQYLLKEFGDEAPAAASAAAADIKKEAGKDTKTTTTTTTKEADAAAERLPLLVERLYVRYRDQIVYAIREDERRIEKVQAEIKLLEQQAAGGGGRGAHARAAEAKAAAAAAAQNQNQNQNQSQSQKASPTLGKNAAPTQAAQQSAPSSRSTSASAQPPSARNTPEHHVPRGPANVPLLPATSRPPTGADAASSSTPSRITPNTALQQQQQQQQQQARTTPQLAPLAPASASASASSQPPSRTPSAVAIQPTQPLPAGQLAGHSAASSQPASRSISPAQPPAHASPPTQQQAGIPPSANAAQLPPKGPAAVPARATPPIHTPGTQTPIPNSPSTTHSAASQTQPAATAQTQPQAAAGAPVGTPRPLVPATQKHTPIAPNPPFQRPPVAAAGAPGGPPMTPGPQGAAGAGVVPRPPLPEHVRGGPPSRTPTPVQSPRPAFPHTPVHGVAGGIGPMFLPRGSGTRWKPSEPTPSTPGPDVGDMASPAYEPLSPVQPSAASRSSRSARADSADLDMADDDDNVDDEETSPVSPSASAVRQSRNLRKPQSQPQTQHARPVRQSARPSRHSRSLDDDSHPIKAEATTPKAFDDVEEAEDVDTRAALKRKRGGDDEEDDAYLLSTTSKPDPSVLARRRLVGTPMPPTHVLWMRGFPKISASALDQISSHRHANMFAHKIRDRDAPGYSTIVRHPVDLKSIRMAITQGNKAAAAALAALEAEGSTPTTNSSVWLPINADLVPPRGIINSSQLESELVHMFANAVMYNPDSHRGPGPAFLVSETADDDEDDLANSSNLLDARYKVDEDGVVNDTRDMYVEVEKLLSEMRSAERQVGMPAPPQGAKGLDLPLDDSEVADPVEADNAKETNDNDDNEKKNDKDDEAAADADEGSGTIKRRRITRNQ